MAKAIDRFYQYLNHKSIKPVSFEKTAGLSNGYLGKQLKRSADLGETIILKIIENCPDLDLIWFLTGKGEMLNSKIDLCKNENSENENFQHLNELIKAYIKTIDSQTKTIESQSTTIEVQKVLIDTFNKKFVAVDMVNWEDEFKKQLDNLKKK